MCGSKFCFIAQNITAQNKKCPWLFRNSSKLLLERFPVRFLVWAKKMSALLLLSSLGFGSNLEFEIMQERVTMRMMNGYERQQRLILTSNSISHMG